MAALHEGPQHIWRCTARFSPGLSSWHLSAAVNVRRRRAQPLPACDAVAGMLSLQIEAAHGQPPPELWRAIADSMELTSAQRQECVPVRPQKCDT